MSEHDRILDVVEAAEHGSEAFTLPHTAFSRAIDGVLVLIGKAASWLWPILVLVIVVQVVLRYVFNQGLITLEELQWHIYAVGFMLGLSFAVVRDRHVRIDVVAERFGRRTRAWIELFGLLLFLLPFAIIVAVEAIPFVMASWRLNEISAAPGGLGGRWMLKSVIIVAFALIALAALSRLSRVTALLFGWPKPLSEDRAGGVR